MTCPKCHGPMRQYERNGVIVDQCTECRGIFLDRGELERIVDAESRWEGSGGHERPRYEDRREEGHRRPEYAEPRYERHGGYDPRRKKRKSFFEELFDD